MTRDPNHECPSCTPELYVGRPPICPRCGADMPDAPAEGGWAFDVCAPCDEQMAAEEES